MTTIKNTKAIIKTWFYFLIKKEGKAIPTLNEFEPMIKI
jgi:hypothetical protein